MIYLRNMIPTIKYSWTMIPFTLITQPFFHGMMNPRLYNENIFCLLAVLWLYVYVVYLLLVAMQPTPRTILELELNKIASEIKMNTIKKEFHVRIKKVLLHFPSYWRHRNGACMFLNSNVKVCLPRGLYL